jgi:prefoldin subunit 4
MQKLLEDLEDASNELLLSDDDGVALLLGECFVSFENDDAEARLEDMTEKVKSDLDTIASELDEAKSEMSRLKSILYSRLGTSINLEE